MKLGQFKTLLKEVVREVIKEELQDLQEVLLEGKFKEKVIKENFTSNTPYHHLKNISTSTGDPLLDLLNETKAEEKWKNMGGGNTQQGPITVGSVGDMLQSNTGFTSDINQIKIDVVPDFSNLMNNMSEKGLI